MAAVGNGHVATVLYSPVVYMNGLYNGPVGWTHRAAIQTIHDVTVHVEGAVDVSRTYTLDMWRAVFTETIHTKGLEIRVMTYAHQRLVQLLVTEIHVTRTDNEQRDYTLVLDRSHMNSTVDLGISDPIQVKDLAGCDNTCLHTYGETHITETKEAEIGKVHIYWTDNPARLHLAGEERTKQWSFFSSYDKVQGKALYAFRTALNIRSSAPHLLLETHEAAWAERWNNGRMDVEGDDDLATTIHASLYYILMSLPSEHSELPLEQFYGLSPGSLARGANWTDYQGHVFWDMETWMYPPILALFPGLARDMLSYRIYGGQGARTKAQSYGYEGWQFPWESAFTGYEMTPLICVPCREYEQHITGDVAFAARQYWALTRNRQWLEEEGGINLIVNTADFWASRGEYDEEKDRYNIDGVMPPDERAKHINNSIYTNFVAKVNLELANYISCVSGQETDTALAQRRLQIARKLYMTFNERGQYHPEYEGYDAVETAWNHDETVKQADTVMLGYPLGMKMDDNVRRNDLTLYEERGDPGGPAMTWSMFAINWLDLNELETAAVHFNNSYQWYTRQPFYTWTEVKTGMGATNFITGMGGFLQAVLFGYGGFRIELEHVSFHPRLPPGTSRFRITGLNYLGGSFDLLITPEHVLFIVRELSEDFPLQLRTKSAGTTWRLKAGMELRLSKEPFEISTLQVTECPMPEGSSCPDVVTMDDSTGQPASVPKNVGTVHVSQAGGDRCRDFLLCSKRVEQLKIEDDTVNFYMGDDGRIYQGSSMASEAGILKIAMLGDYTLSGMSQEQEALLRRLVKCGMEAEPANINPKYKLQYGAQPAEDCGSAPCAGNSLHCQLKAWRHWDSSQEAGAPPNCRSGQNGMHIPTPRPRPRPTGAPLLTPHPSTELCPPVQPAEVVCKCQTQTERDVSNAAVARVTSPALPLWLLVAMLSFVGLAEKPI